MLDRILQLFAREPIASPISRAGHAFAATIAILLGSFVSYIQYNAYPVLSGATLFMFSMAMLVGVVVAGASFASNKLMIILAAGLGYLGAGLFGLGWPIFGATFLGSLVALKNVRGLGMIAIVFGFVGLTSPLRPVPPAIERGPEAEGRTTLQPLVHIILDAQAPVDYTDLGYSYWTNAEAVSWRTKVSLPNIVNGYPDYLTRKGYSVEIWQSDYFDFCSARCTEFRNHSLDLVQELDLEDQHLIVAGSFLSQLEEHELPYQLWALNSRRALEQVVDRAHELGPGEALVAHVIMPHSPYVLDDKCHVKPVREWKARHHDGAALAYDEQVQCAKSIIARLPENAHVIVHGDHGHRRSPTDFRDDTKAALNAHFAVRDGNRAVHEERAQLRDLLWSYVGSLPSAE